MVTATKTVETREVVRTVQVEVPTYTLTLSENAARALMTVVGHVGGHPGTTARSHFLDIGQALAAQGVCSFSRCGRPVMQQGADGVPDYYASLYFSPGLTPAGEEEEEVR